MAPAAKNNTPGRRKRTDNQYFEPGKRGRKTGLELKDLGQRDEHGLEPMSGIFSSPHEQNGDKTLTSEDMDVQNSSAPDIRQTLSQRKTPRFPPPRQSTPRRTNIGSPKRMSSAKPRQQEQEEEDDDRSQSQPPANRRLDFGGQTNRNRKSIHTVETQSPFKPRHALRRSTGPGRPDVFALPIADDEDEEVAKTSIEHPNDVVDEEDEDEEMVEQSIEDGPIFQEDGDDYPMEIDQTAGDLDPTEVRPSSNSPLKRKPGRPRKSDQSVNSSQIDANGSGRKKRNRASLENDHSQAESSAQGAMNPPARKKRSSGADKVVVHRDGGDETIDPSEIAHGDQYMVDDDAEGVPEADLSQQLDSQLVVEAESQQGKKGKGKKGKGKAAAPKERDANRSMQNRASSVRDSPSKRAQRGTSVGPVSNVNLRAVTPFEDAGHTQSRFGRNLIQPLKYWENESRIWKSGEIEGIVRAEHVEKPKPKTKRRKKGGRRGNLESIDEESETESIMPDEWEDEQGVISGTVANWNPAIKAGDPEDPVQEDLAFAASSIVTRDVAGSEFKYAKIMTIPFFGAGIVELPPEGYKRAKNSRKMQMVFFVHEGKVMVEVGATGLEVNSFTLSKGGCWVVPRGNNYAITNESRTRSAKVFFAQGCVVEGTE
ncbi:hypothetical protein M409DRAFT_30090 [Zasmidium cellare ATCC 36951]|uniref:Mif2/CENP-C cupin domain-containing protein n=1 Tax=Zasmidium cellare ATCC 36951 TaxID=1080233 RepID=A0A6A6C0X8_ZASCE|nr:uncharacterized protein M409DRAFT_30090 [Zasmidium cellare ATCC 36951]KAF2159469.1 hypothetical protein M409DRAFT_30090 [Zasmidium cellare ATCC 36951]